jgi:biopolymer transport protein ExbD
MWRASDLVECLIFIGLALMLAYTAFITVRFFRRYFLAHRTPFVLFADCTTSSEQSKKNFVADLSCGLRTLQSIAFAAPFLGLAGTCYGILCLFARGWVLKWWSPVQISVALVATAAGLIVAMPAAISYNILRTCLEKFEGSRASTLLEATPRSYGFAQTLPLRERFSRLPAFALIAAPVLGILIPLFALILSPPTPVGLPVQVLKISPRDHDLPPIIISVIATNGSGRAVLYVNSKETSWEELGNTLRSQLKVRSHWVVYVEGEDYASWRDVVNVIDVARGLHAEVVLLTAAPKIDSGHRPKAKATKNARVR